jgi:hypothetical protein
VLDPQAGRGRRAAARLVRVALIRGDLVGALRELHLDDRVLLVGGERTCGERVDGAQRAGQLGCLGHQARDRGLVGGGGERRAVAGGDHDHASRAARLGKLSLEGVDGLL